MRTSTLLLTCLALLAFAANSLLCRMALLPDAIDAVSFTTLRIGAGALVLAPLVVRSLRATAVTHARPPLRSALALFTYAVAFSLAYTTLTTGTGALLLFGAVQITMIGAGLVAGERPRALEWLGAIAALAGLVWLVLPGVAAPPLVGALLMIGAGISWGAYSLLGRAPASSGRTPSRDTAWSFARAVPLALVALAIAMILAHVDVTRALHVTATGALLAIASGAVTSGLGYVVWYTALRGHTATSAAVVQAAVPVIAALGGVVVLDEHVTSRLLVATALVIGGIGVAVASRRRR